MEDLFAFPVKQENFWDETECRFSKMSNIQPHSPLPSISSLLHTSVPVNRSPLPGDILQEFPFSQHPVTMNIDSNPILPTAHILPNEDKDIDYDDEQTLPIDMSKSHMDMSNCNGCSLNCVLEEDEKQLTELTNMETVTSISGMKTAEEIYDNLFSTQEPDLESWQGKHILHWDKNDVMNFIYSLSLKTKGENKIYGENFQEIDGKRLSSMHPQEIIKLAPDFGKVIIQGLERIKNDNAPCEFPELQEIDPHSLHDPDLLESLSLHQDHHLHHHHHSVHHQDHLLSQHLSQNNQNQQPVFRIDEKDEVALVPQQLSTGVYSFDPRDNFNDLIEAGDSGYDTPLSGNSPLYESEQYFNSNPQIPITVPIQMEVDDELPNTDKNSLTQQHKEYPINPNLSLNSSATTLTTMTAIKQQQQQYVTKETTHNLTSSMIPHLSHDLSIQSVHEALSLSSSRNSSTSDDSELNSSIHKVRKQRGRPRTRVASNSSTSSDNCDLQHDLPKPPKSNRGRKKGQVSNKGNHLWEFIRDLLKDPNYNPSHIQWEDAKAGVFRIIKSKEVSALWGKKKNNATMNYEKLSRALRFCREQRYFGDLPKDGSYPKKLCFKFGEKATGWRLTSLHV